MENKNPLNIIKKKVSVENQGKDAKTTPKPYTKSFKKYPKTTYTPDRIKNMLKDYRRIGKDLWSRIPINSHIRYFRTDGAFRTGGFVINHYEKKGKSFIHLANSRTDYKKRSNYATWPIAHEDVARIYKKPGSGSVSLEMNDIKTNDKRIKREINRLVDVVKEQKRRLDKQENDIRRLYNAISKLNLTRRRSGTRSR